MFMDTIFAARLENKEALLYKSGAIINLLRDAFPAGEG
jgi:hypothetical protein